VPAVCLACAATIVLPFLVPKEVFRRATHSIAVAVPEIFFCHFLPKNRMSSPKTS
jgi:hypothetical protein